MERKVVKRKKKIKPSPLESKISENLNGEIKIYSTAKNKKIDVRLEGETIWLTQKQMSELFETTVANINLHILNIYKGKELDKKTTIKESLIVQQEGQRTVSRKTEHYNLDLIISLGYRVKSI